MLSINIFVCYAHADERWVTEGHPCGLLPWLRNQLKNNAIHFWWDHGIHAGDDFERRIYEKIDEVQVVILLISDDFAGSDYIIEKELPRIRNRYDAGEILVIPILISSISQLNRERLTWVIGIQMLPNDQKGLNVIVNSDLWPETRAKILDEIYHRICLIRTSAFTQVESPGLRSLGNSENYKEATEIENRGSVIASANIEESLIAAKQVDLEFKSAALDSIGAVSTDQTLAGTQVDLCSLQELETDTKGVFSFGVSRVLAIIFAIHVCVIGILFVRANLRKSSSKLESGESAASELTQNGTDDKSASQIHRRQKTFDDFMLIPSGKFLMGDAIDRDTDAPQHTVEVSAFHIAKYPVTKLQWDEVRDWGLSHGYADIEAGLGKAPNHPVHTISWYSMLKWCNALGEKEGLTACYMANGEIYKTGNNDAVICNWTSNGYRLPTEAEWEKAARGGVAGKRFPWGDTIDQKQANYESTGKTAYDLGGSLGYHTKFNDGIKPYTSPVGSFDANGYGLYDMAGNVCEWCWDWFGSRYYISSPNLDPQGPSSGSNRVGRGGSWAGSSLYCRVANRAIGKPSKADSGMGFRIVRGYVNHQTLKSAGNNSESSSSTPCLTPARQIPRGNSNGFSVRSIRIDEIITFAEIAEKNGVTIDRLNELNGLSLTGGAALAKGSELYVPMQP